MSRPADVPEHAECLSALDHSKSVRTPSVLAPGAEQLRVTLCCPACKTDLGVLCIPKTLRCDCGLSLRSEYFDLYIWRETVTA